LARPGVFAAFGAAVAGRRLHVAAKRWICATDPGYFDRLSPGSVRSLVWSVAQQCRGDQVRCRILARR